MNIKQMKELRRKLSLIGFFTEGMCNDLDCLSDRNDEHDYLIALIEELDDEIRAYAEMELPPIEEYKGEK